MSTLSYILSDITGFNDIIKSSDNNLNVLKLNKVECRTSNSTYKIIRYDKNFLNIDLVSSYGLCRSVIINSKNDVVGFAPPKSISAELFIQKYNKEYLINEIVIGEALEKLNEKQKEAITFYFFEELTQEEAALKAGITQASFSKRLDRALKTLKGIIEDPL